MKKYRTECRNELTKYSEELELNIYIGIGIPVGLLLIFLIGSWIASGFKH
jgi:hypothetical protein